MKKFISVLFIMPTFAFAQVTLAPVRTAVPVYENITSQNCWNESVVAPTYNVPQPNMANSIVGGVVGAAIGSRFGGGSGRDIATVAGAIAGSHIANSYQNYPTTNTTIIQKCSPVVTSKLVGYDVSYEYNGQIYIQRMPYNPGSYVQVSIVAR